MYPRSEKAVSASICEDEVYDFFGHQLTQSGTYSQTLPNHLGCDSTIVLTLEVIPTITEVRAADICHGEVYNFGGRTLRAPGTYTDSLTSASGCDSILILELTVYPQVLPQVKGQEQLCPGDTAYLTVATTENSYIWSTGDTTETIAVTEAGTYSVTVTSFNFCTGSSSFDVSIAPEAVAPVGVDGVLSCAEDSYRLGVLPAARGDFRWTGPGINATNATQPNPLIDVSGWYYLNYTNEAGCTARDSVFVDYLQTPSGADVESFNSCEDQSDGTIRVLRVYDGAPPYEYILSGNGFRTNTTGTFENLPPGNYQLTVQDNNMCTWDTTLTIVQAPPVAVSLGPDIELILGESVQLNAITNLAPADIQSFSWDPTDWLSCTDCFGPFATPLDNITYTFTIVDRNGCLGQDQISLVVDKRPNIYVPSGFSPNGDGQNDVITVFAGPGVVLIDIFRIYDRWGDKVFEDGGFEPNDLTRGWNGVFRGKPMDPAVFAFYIKATLLNGEQVLIKGDITLVR